MMKQYNNFHDKTNNNNWISIVGIGEDGIDGLSKTAIKCLQEAEFVFGGERHLAFLNRDFSAEQIVWSKPFTDNIGLIRTLKGHRIVLLTSGDPMFYGAGVTFLNHFSPHEVVIHPHVSSFSLAAARLGWPLQDVECCSVHGRTMSSILRFIEHGTRLLVLSNDGRTPALLAEMLQKKGFASSKMVVLEHLAGKKEHIVSDEASAFIGKFFADLNIIAIDCICLHPSLDFSRFSILPDHAFIHDGQLTKQDVRAVILAHLAPKRSELLWDVGAGCGTVSIEWLRLHLNASAIAIEQNSNRCDYIRQNADKHGCPNLHIVEGKAPSVLHDLKKPDAVFIGGGTSLTGLLETCWQALKPGGRLVANAVTLEAETAMIQWNKSKSARLLKHVFSSSEPLGGFHVWRQSLPIVTLIAHKS